jgi:hypothetical protein
VLAADEAAALRLSNRREVVREVRPGGLSTSVRIGRSGWAVLVNRRGLPVSVRAGSAGRVVLVDPHGLPVAVRAGRAGWMMLVDRGMRAGSAG